MANSLFATQRLMREKKKMELNPSDTFLALPTFQNIFEWHFLLFNFANDSPFNGGQFHGIINIPIDYPLKPPDIKFVTPNGRFVVGEKICLSFTNYHPEIWSSSWTIASMLVGLVSFMHTNEKTLGGVDCNNQQKQVYAKMSIEHNLQNPKFIELFSSHFNKLGIQQNDSKETQCQQPELKVSQLEQRQEEQPVLNANINNFKIIINDNNNIDDIDNNDINNINDKDKNDINNNNNNNDNNNINNDDNNKINNNIHINNNNNNNAAKKLIVLIVLLLAFLLLIFYIIFTQI